MVYRSLKEPEGKGYSILESKLSNKLMTIHWKSKLDYPGIPKTFVFF